jgi:hypothetical protein
MSSPSLSLRAATVDGSRREQGWWIRLDTTTGAYGKSGETVGPSIANNVGASMSLPSKPPDSIADPSPVDQPTYTVGWFHTHTPTTFRTAADFPTPGGRGAGPSPTDQSLSSNSQVPGVAYDYDVDPVPPLYPMDSPAHMYPITPPERRPVP